MKIKNYFLMLALGLCLSFSMTACSDDDDEVTPTESTTDDTDDTDDTEDTTEDDTTTDEESTGLAAAVAGTYSGYVDVMFTYVSNPYAYPEETLTITEADDTTVDIAYENSTWGTYAVSGATVTDNGDGTYTIEGTGTATMAGHSSTSEYDADFTATIAEGESEFGFTMAVMGTTYVNFHEGDAPASYYILSETYKRSFTGYTEMEFAYVTNPLGAASQTINVVLNTEDYSVVDVTYESDYGTFTVSAATATDNGDGTYTLDMVEVGNLALDMNMSGHAISGDYEISSFTATISDDGSTFIFGMDFMGGTTATFYEGDSPAAYIAQGDYEGALAISAYGVNVGSVAETVTIEATGHEEATVTLPAFDISVAAMGMTMSLGDMDITGVAVSTSDSETCSLSASNVSFSTTLNGEATTVTATISGSVTNGEEQSGEIEFTFTLGSMTISATFTVGATVEDDTDTDTDTDTETGTAGGATDIAGTYTGTIGLYYSSMSVGSADSQTLIIEATSDETATITLSAFSIYVSMLGGDFALSDIVLEGVSVSTLSDGSYYVYATDMEVPVTFDETDTTVTGSLSGTISSDKSSVDLTFELDFGGMAFTATFTI